VSVGHVYFIGAGPGAPDLITIRGRTVLERADLIIYADSLVDPHICDGARPDAEIHGSSSLTLEEISERMITAARAGKVVARVQSGDPTIYGAIHEQIARLDAASVPWTIVPGVSSAFAAAAALGVELTVPEVAQTVILTRISGRASPVPSPEALRSLAAHRTSLVLFMSISYVARVVADLVAGGYPPETPVAAVYRVTWPDEAAVRGTLADIAAKVRAARWKKQALILVGAVLGTDVGADGHRSRLYAGDYSHLFRKKRDPKGAPARPAGEAAAS